MTYQGWTNHATWMVNLHLVNDAGTYDWINELAENAWQDNDGELSSYRMALATAIEAYVNGDDGIDVFGIAEVQENNTFLSDVITSFMADVDWLEIAKSWIDDPLAEFGPIEDDEDEDEFEFSMTD